MEIFFDCMMSVLLLGNLHSLHLLNVHLYDVNLLKQFMFFHWLVPCWYTFFIYY